MGTPTAILSKVLMSLGHIEESVQHNEEALRIDATDVKAIFRRSLLRLLQGDLEGAWQDYEQAARSLPDWPPPLVQGPRWDGSSLMGKTIVVFSEQGLGDTIQFVRAILPLVKEPRRQSVVRVQSRPAKASGRHCRR